MSDVGFGAGIKIIDTKYIMAPSQKTIA